MGMSIGLVANVYNEVNALPGWLETHLPYFDDVRVLHTGPRGELSNDGTMELLEKWHVPVEVGSIDEGFGVVRTKAIHSSPCEYVMLLDTDERFFPVVKSMRCSGVMNSQEDVDLILRDYDFRAKDSIAKCPNWENIRRLGSGLSVAAGAVYDQGAALRDLLNVNRPDAVVVARRHWHDFSMHRPTQDWETVPDFQLRILKNSPDIHYDPTIRMHERLVGAEVVCGLPGRLFFDHFHFVFKSMEPAQRAHDTDIYDAVHAGRTPPTWGEYKASKGVK